MTVATWTRRERPWLDPHCYSTLDYAKCEEIGKCKKNFLLFQAGKEMDLAARSATYQFQRFGFPK